MAKKLTDTTKQIRDATGDVFLTSPGPGIVLAAKRVGDKVVQTADRLHRKVATRFPTFHRAHQDATRRVKRAVRGRR